MNGLFQKYTIDTNAIDELWLPHRNYPKEYFVTLWDNVFLMFKNYELISHIEVYKEIQNGGYTELKKWARIHKKFFQDYSLPHEGTIIAQLGGMGFSSFVSGKKLKSVHADPWLVAQAKINNLVVITQENDDGSPMKIPTVCRSLGVGCISIVGLIKDKSWKF